MDETGYLKENEIYCVVQMNSGTMQTLTGSVIITRCPALHPGDIQVVSAVDVPPDSALRALHNMVVFSSFGDRDLPSKLSGGDLDGDLYNIIWDHKLYPKVFSRPAEYETASPIDIQRPVERDDITNHFLTFMKNDNLGMIATLHQILADQSDDGTLDPQCIRVADLHSTAVDFSKSGIAVSTMCPSCSNILGLTKDRLKGRIYPSTRKLAPISKLQAPKWRSRKTSTWQISKKMMI